MPSRFSTKITYYFGNKTEIKEPSLDSDRDLLSTGLPAPGGQAGQAGPAHTCWWWVVAMRTSHGKREDQGRAAGWPPGVGVARGAGLWLTSSFFLGVPACLSAPTRERSRSPATPSLGTLTLSLLLSLHMGHSFRQCYYSIEPSPSLRQGWSYREREEQAEVIAVKQMGQEQMSKNM